MTPQDLYRLHRGAVVNLVVVRDNQRIGSGTGFIMHGRLITCAHVVDTIPPGCLL
jgi:hypothetical protein